MSNEEKYIRETFGQANPFRVPEGYFDQLTQQVMSQLPERQKKSRIVALRPWLYAAACTVAVAVLGLTYHFHQTTDEQQMASVALTSTESTYVDDAADYAMLDNAEIYAYLSDN